MTNVLVAERNLVMREGIKALLSRSSNFHLIADVSSKPELISALQYHCIDVLLLDVHLGGMTGETLIRRIRSVSSRTHILGFSSIDDLALGSRGIRAGLKGYIHKSCTADDFLHALSRVAEGRPYISRAMAEQLVEKLHANVESLPHLILTERELDVFHRLTTGESLSSIANRLSLSIKTVSTHKVRLLHKMGLPNITALVQYAVKHNLL